MCKILIGTLRKEALEPKTRKLKMFNQQHSHFSEITGGCILTDVSFKAKSGELSVILGGSGSGKTTLLDAIAHRLDGRGHPSGKVTTSIRST